MTRFHVRVTSFEDLTELPGSWTGEDFRALLEAMDYGDVSGLGEGELREMCVLSLQDRKPAAAAALLLQHRLGSELSKGQIQNVSHEMQDEKLWEHYADMPLHERLFHVASLLYQAFPSVVPLPDAVAVELEVRTEDPEGERVLAKPLPESLVVRLLADGMPDSSQVKRMFRDALGGQPFHEAESIVWTVATEAVDARAVKLEIVGSGCWLDALRETKSFGSDARADPELRVK